MMTQYKDSGVEWLGLIPDHWEAKRIKYYIDNEQNGVWGDEAKGDENDIVCLRVADFDREHLITRLCDTSTIRNLEIDKFQNRILKHNDLMIEKSGGGDNQLVGFVTRYISNTPVICSNFVAKLSLSNHVDAKYTTYLFSLLYSNKINYKSIKQTSGIQNIDTAQYFNEVVPFPPLTEQQQIANYLDLQTTKIDELVQKQNKLITTLQEKKKSLINYVVTKGIRPHAVMLDTNVFNDLLHNKDLLDKLPSDIKYYATNIQLTEIQNDPDEEHKKELLKIFENVVDEVIPSIDQEWFIFGQSNFSNYRFASESESNELKKLSATESDNKGKHVNDTLTLITGKNLDFVISSDKRTPFKRAKNGSYNVLSLNEFIDKYALKDSGVEWLGRIPKHWTVKKLKHVGSAIIGLTYSPENIVDEGTAGILVLRSSNVQQGILSFEDNVYVNMEVPKELLVQENDILICSRNGSRALIGKNAKIDKSTAGSTFGAFMTIFRSKCNNFIYYILNSSLFDFQSSMFLTSTINQLTAGNLNNFEFPLPSIEEQQQIANYLDLKTAKIDELINKAKSMVELLKEHKQSLINHVITGKIKVL